MNFFIYSNHKVKKETPIPSKTPCRQAVTFRQVEKCCFIFSDEEDWIQVFIPINILPFSKQYIGEKAQASNVLPLSLGLFNAVPEFPDKSVENRKIQCVFYR